MQCINNSLELWLFSLLAIELLKPGDVKMDKTTREAENEEKRNAGKQEEV